MPRATSAFTVLEATAVGAAVVIVVQMPEPGTSQVLLMMAAVMAFYLDARLTHQRLRRERAAMSVRLETAWRAAGAVYAATATCPCAAGCGCGPAVPAQS